MEDVIGKDLINYSCIKDKRNRQVNGHFNRNIKLVLKQLNEQGHDIYFIVNSGGYKNSEITKINAVFIDFDCGRDENKQYYPLQVVKDYKKDRLAEVDNFTLVPTYVNDTRNGLHVFWLVNEGATVEQFIECQERLIAYFGSDDKIKNPNRAMRVPGFNWTKEPNNPYMCNILEHNEVRYDIEDIIKILPPIDSEDKEGGGVRTSDKKEYLNYYSISGTSIPHFSDNLKLIRDRKVDALRDILNAKPITLNNHEEVYDYLKKQDLHQFLGVSGNKFNCIFHEDKKPSAGIIINEETGHYIYNCFSSNCTLNPKGKNNAATIIQIVEHLTNYNKVDALRFLRKVYNITYAETAWQKEQREILCENMRFLLSRDIEDFYPEIYKLIKRYIPELYMFHEFGKQHVTTENFTDSNNQPVFFISLNEFSRLCHRDAKSISNRLGLFAYLGLINKLSEEEVPEPFLRRAKHLAARYKHKNIINFYSIPSYSHNNLEYCTRKAIEFKEKKFTIRGWSREMLFRALGEEEANRVFPQLKGKPFTPLSVEVTIQMERVALDLIKHKGWTTEREIIDSIMLKFPGQEKFKETHIKRIIPEMLDKYCLTKRKLTNQLKDKFCIDIKGYPYIICFEEGV
ncbi:hypothetical protein N752_24420 [Desulforamulus aquiferis]|nr:hypothetical protein [Desulforamulus aquiferis]RYD02477.1 hypothetical protein N752_24420 [Desulforamulus aquiferis]